MAKIQLKDLFKSYGKTEIVHGINLEINDGEFMVFVGPSGCGKSTCLRMVAGLESITGGDVVIGERAVNDLPPQKRNIAMVFQNYALYPHKTVAENIVFGLRKQKVAEDKIQEKLEEVAESLQLSEYLERKPAALSGGQRQRVAMGRAIARNADAFLFDEPLSNLDAKLRHAMRTEIRRLHRRLKTTTIYVTHDQIEAMTLADRVCVLRDGYIEQVGRPMELYLNPANIFVATFIGSPAMNIMNAILTSDEVQIEPDLKLKLTLKQKENASKYLNGKDSKEVKFGIRPDFIHDSAFEEGGEVQKAGEFKVDVIEPLGFEKEVIVHVGEQKMLARLDLRSDVVEDSNIGLSIDVAQGHIFDIETEKNINTL